MFTFYVCIYVINFSDLLVGCIYSDQLLVCCVIVYSGQPLVGSLYTGISYQDTITISDQLFLMIL